MNFVSKLFSPRYLLYTNVALGSSFYAVGDFSEQQLHQTIKRVVGSDSKPAPSYDQQRTGEQTQDIIKNALVR